jgi:hypothetical protein
MGQFNPPTLGPRRSGIRANGPTINPKSWFGRPGPQSHCAIGRTFDDVAARFVRTNDGLSLVLESPNWKLERGKHYSVRMKAGATSWDTEVAAESNSVSVPISDKRFNSRYLWIKVAWRWRDLTRVSIRTVERLRPIRLSRQHDSPDDNAQSQTLSPFLPVAGMMQKPGFNDSLTEAKNLGYCDPSRSCLLCLG